MSLAAIQTFPPPSNSLPYPLGIVFNLFPGPVAVDENGVGGVGTHYGLPLEVCPFHESYIISFTGDIDVGIQCLCAKDNEQSEYLCLHHHSKWVIIQTLVKLKQGTI